MSDPLWLTVDQQRIWRAYLAGVARVNEYLDADLRRFGLSLGEYEVLVCLAEADDERLRMAELADLVRSSRSKLSHTISRMERRNLVRRSSDCDDGRGVFALLTTDGRALLDAAAPHHVAAVRRILVDAVGPEDYAALGRAMEAVASVAD